MHSYRFRILLDDQEDFVRDIDLLANQTFEDFHHVLVTSLQIDGNELASFFICDYRWRKLKELTLLDMKTDEIFDDEDDDDRDRKKPLPVLMMNAVKIKEAIIDPHQRLIYEYDFLNPKVFFVELIKILPADISLIYPMIIRSEGAFLKTPGIKHVHEENGIEEVLLKDTELLDDEFTIDEDDFDTTQPEGSMW